MPMSNKGCNKHRPLRQTGFSLVEILVGLAIGLLVTLVIMQVFTVFEGQKRSTTGSADAQTNGSIALYTIQRDVQMAGFGLPVFDTVNPPLKCDPSPTVDHDGNPATPQIDMFPLRITDGGVAAGASDSIAIRYGLTPMGGVPIKINSSPGVNPVGVDNNMGCQNGDIAMISQGTSCTMTKVTALTGTTGITLASTPLSPPLNIGSSLACMGNWNEFVYTIANNQLQRNDASGVATTPIIADIVNIQAQYGISAAANSNQIIQWVNATNTNSGGVDWRSTDSGAPLYTPWTPTVANRNLIKAIRIAVVARNGLLEKTNVTAACTTALGTVNNGPCAWDDTTPLVPGGSIPSPAPKIDLSKNSDGTANPDWQRYRYRVFETIIPLRNMVWSRNTL